ncbi:hypothetical protein MXB_2087 [Myxobolus squamalis]|nr:hypothetical protein MXB_2087 [Myxobolus squamalis]
MPLKTCNFIILYIRLLDNYNCLFEIIKKIIQDSVVLEKEIFDCNKLKDQGKKEYYKKNSAWSNGIIGFAKSIAPAVSISTESLNGFVKGEASIEEVTVSLKNMVALVTQFVMACKTKADLQSKPLASIQQGAREMYNIAHSNVDKIKALQMPSLEPPIDISSLTKTKKVAFENDLKV